MSQEPGRLRRRRRRREEPEDGDVGDLRALLAGEEDEPAQGLPGDLPPPPENPTAADLAGSSQGGDGGWEVIEQMFQGAAPPEAEKGLELDWRQPQVFTEPSLEEVVRRLEDLGHNVGVLDKRVRETAALPRPEPQRPVVPPALTARLQSLEERIDMLLKGQAETASQADEGLAALGREVSRLSATVSGDTEANAMALTLQRLETLESNLEAMRVHQERAARESQTAAELSAQESQTTAASVESALQELRALIEGAQAAQEARARDGDAGPPPHSILESLTSEITGQVITETVDRLTDFELGIAERLDNLEAMVAERQERFQGQLADRLAGLEERLTESLAEREAESASSREIAARVGEALARDPFELVSAEDIDELTAGIAAKVRRMSRRVDRLETILDRGLSGVEQARRAAAAAALEMERAARRAADQWRKAEAVGKKAGAARTASKASAKPAPKASAKPAPKPTGRKPAPKASAKPAPKPAGRKPVARRRSG